MARLRIGVTRYAAVLEEIEQRLAPTGGLTCQIGAGRMSLVLRGVGATRWEPEAQLARALELAAAARARLAADGRAPVRAHARHAVVVRFEDVSVAAGCDVRAQWECVIPSPAG